MTIFELRQQLLKLVSEADLPAEEARVLKEFVTGLQLHDDMSVSAFLKLLSRSGPKLERTPPTTSDVVAEYVSSLESAFRSDDAFRSELKRLQADRRATREVLNQIYETMTQRSRRLTAKATKAKLIQDIADFRLERVRSEKAAEMFKGKPVYAE
ncbi:MAG: hypothetical protein NW206_00895 [Hyphomonadaceae bacterium]|nr:hypothetical protein [Hyphomonadaceae bacterium]